MAKKKTVVEWMTSFISNMRAERVEGEEKKSPEFLAMIEKLKELVKYFSIVQVQPEEQVGEDSIVNLVIELNKTGGEKFSIDDLTQEEQVEFLKYTQPMKFSIVSFETYGEAETEIWDCGWDADINWETNKSSVMATFNLLQGKATSMVGEAYFVLNGTRYEGLDAVSILGSKVQNSGEMKITLTINDEVIELSSREGGK